MAALGRMIKAQVRYYTPPADTAIPVAKQKFIPASGTYPKGFNVSGTHVGVKASNTKFPDLALITSDTPCSAAAVFTTNKFQAAPVQVSRDILQRRQGKGIRSVVINTGSANAVTGKGGLEDATRMGNKVDECNGSKDPSTLVMSTGVIGQRYGPRSPQKPKTSTKQSRIDSRFRKYLPKSRKDTTTSPQPMMPGSPPHAPCSQQIPSRNCSLGRSPSPRPRAARTASPA